jgi:catechol 2,3-dioxygenase-like lactoylglutathione lyase family enzyme
MALLGQETAILRQKAQKGVQSMHYRMRVARPVIDIARAKAMYCDGLGLKVIASFQDHEGFDGIMLGADGVDFHFEFTHCKTHPVQPRPTPEDLLVFYVPDASEWKVVCDRMVQAGFSSVRSFNPYWDKGGRTFQDFDGYLVVIQNADWQK